MADGRGYDLLSEGGEDSPRAAPRPCRCGHPRSDHPTCRCLDPNHSRRGCTRDGCSCRGYTTRGQAEMATTLAQARRALAEAVLIAHQRHTDQHCLCGWGELGASHAAHVVDELQAEGVLPRG